MEKQDLSRAELHAPHNNSGKRYFDRCGCSRVLGNKPEVTPAHIRSLLGETLSAHSSTDQARRL